MLWGFQATGTAQVNQDGGNNNNNGIFSLAGKTFPVTPVFQRAVHSF